jgi:hypothetical protein
MARWWYIADNQRHGPVTLPVIKGLLRDRVLHAESFVWHEGLQQWVPAASIDELRPLIHLDLPPLPGHTHQEKSAVKTLDLPIRHNTMRWVLLCLAVVMGIMAYTSHIHSLAGWFKYARQETVLSSILPMPPTPATKTDMTPHRWQNPLTLKSVDFDNSWTIKPLNADSTGIACSFISDSIVVNLSVAQAQYQPLVQLVDYVKSHEPDLHFINLGTYGQIRGQATWTGIATSQGDQNMNYVVHVIDSKAGYGIIIAVSKEQTEASVRRLEVLMAALDRTFSG